MFDAVNDLNKRNVRSSVRTHPSSFNPLNLSLERGVKPHRRRKTFSSKRNLWPLKPELKSPMFKKCPSSSAQGSSVYSGAYQSALCYSGWWNGVRLHSMLWTALPKQRAKICKHALHRGGDRMVEGDNSPWAWPFKWHLSHYTQSSNPLMKQNQS